MSNLNWKQTYDLNSTTTFLSNDIFYLARSPYGVGDDFGFLYSSLIPVATKGDLFTFSTNNAALAVGSTNGQILQVNSAAATGLSWSTATYPTTITANQLLYSTSSNVVGSLSAGTSSVLVSNASSVPSWTSAMTNGQVVIGSTSGTPVPATLTAGTNISITNGSNSITIASTAVSLSWTTVTGTSQAMTSNKGYIANNASLVTFTLPSSPNVGDIVAVVGEGAGGWQINAAATQTIYVGNVNSSSDGTGYIASTTPQDAIQLICYTSSIGGTGWVTLVAPQGNIYVKSTVSGTNNALNGNLSSCYNLSLTTGVTGILPIPNGGTNISSYTLGDTLYASASNTLSKLPGNTSATQKFLSQTGTGSASAAPVWSTISGSSVTGSALTEVNDTNVTLTLGGSPSNALLNATSITAGWTGQLSLSRGGTAASLTASNGGIVYSTASALGILAGTSTANQVLLSGSSTTPAWSTATYPATTTINQLLYSSVANTISGVTAGNNGVLISSSSGVPSWLANSGTAGYVLTANSGAPPSWQAAASSGITTIDGDSGSVTGSTITITGGTSGAVFTGSSTTLTESFNYLSLPTTSSTNGQIKINGVVAMQMYGTSNWFGGGAGNFTLTGTDNYCVGGGVLSGATSASYNQGMGLNALSQCTSGTDNNAIGYFAMSANTTGSDNVAIGSSALSTNTTFGRNVAVGALALNNANGGQYNVAVGYHAMDALTTGTENTVVGGFGAVSFTTGSNNIIVGYNTGNNYVGAESSNIIIANTGVVSENNVMRLGTQGTGAGQQSTAYIAGIIGNTASASTSQLVFCDSSTTKMTTLANGTAGYVLTANSGSAPTWQATNGNIGNANNTTRAAFAYKNNTTQTLNKSSAQQISFPNAEFDQNSNVSSSVFTAPVTGVYLFSVMMSLLNVNGGTEFYAYVATTAENIFLYEMNPTVVITSGLTLSGSVICKMSAGDTASVYTYMSGGTSTYQVFGGNSGPRFSGYLLC